MTLTLHLEVRRAAVLFARERAYTHREISDRGCPSRECLLIVVASGAAVYLLIGLCSISCLDPCQCHVNTNICVPVHVAVIVLAPRGSAGPWQACRRWHVPFQCCVHCHRARLRGKLSWARGRVQWMATMSHVTTYRACRGANIDPHNWTDHQDTTGAMRTMPQ